MSDILTTREVRQRLVNKFGRTSNNVLVPEHLVLFEVTLDGRPKIHKPSGIQYGRASRQRVDAVAVGIWRRTQYLVHGFEIKVSRADLLAELRDPSKAEAGARQCDRWWLALGHPQLLRDSDTVPDGWGVLVPRGRGLTVLREPAPMPGECSRGFVASLVSGALSRPTYRRSIGYQAGLAKGYAILDKREKAANGWADAAYKAGLEQGRAEAAAGLSA